MDDTTTESDRQEISLLESLNSEWLKLPLRIMQDVGPAAQTMGGILKLTNRETFSSVSDIAHKARVPIGTARKHLLTLDANGWIQNRGRQHTRRGAPRRTATIALTSKAKTAATEYAVLPWWTCCSIRKVGKLPWSAKAVLSVVMARLMSLKAVVERDDGHLPDVIEQRTEDEVYFQDGDADDDGYRTSVRRGVVDEVTEEMLGQIDNLGGEDRFRFSLSWLMQQTGLTHDSVTSAKRLLNHRFGIVRWAGTPRLSHGKFKSGTTPEPDYLIPNWDFRVVVTDAGDGKCWLDFRQVKG
jgi:DNA-binding MarR family transcriptional regulator